MQIIEIIYKYNQQSNKIMPKWTAVDCNVSLDLPPSKTLGRLPKMQDPDGILESSSHYWRLSCTDK